MADYMEHVNDICEMKEKLIDWTKEELSKSKECIDTHEMGEVIDMIKDLFEAEEKCWKSCYYKLLVEEDDTETYDQRRYYDPSSTPKAMINRGLSRYKMKRGYVPTVDYNDWDYNDVYMRGEDWNRDPKHTKTAYEMYNDSRRHYTQTHETKDREEMEMHANKHMAEAIASVKEIWRHAEPEMRERMKNDVTALMNSMT